MLRVVTGVICALALASCSKGNPILGKWECAEEGSLHVETQRYFDKNYKSKSFQIEFTEKERIHGKDRKHTAVEYDLQPGLVVVYENMLGTRRGVEYSIINDNKIEKKLNPAGKIVCNRVQ